MLTPRQYQSDAATAAVDFMRKNREPGILELTTAAGKSIIAALISHVVHRAGKRVLCLGPNADIVSQNASKYRATGERCSIFSASLGKKNTAHNVVFATPQSVVRSLDRFDDSYALLIVDEAHGVNDDESTTYQKIIRHLMTRNHNLRVLGLTATPMRMKEKLIGNDNTFKHLIYSLPHHKLCEMGYVVPFSLGPAKEHYDLAGVKVQSNGKFKASDIDDATLHHERLSKAIVADVMRIMKDDGRKCCMLFASSIKHAQEILSYFPQGDAVMVTGGDDKKKRQAVLEAVRRGEWRYIINVAVLTTGVDLPIVDTIALLRATESIGLLLQILGRGCRLHDPQWPLPPSEMNWQHPDYHGKRDCLVLDYGENIERFALDDNLTITGLVEAKLKEEDGEYFAIACPECGTENRHTAHRCIGKTFEGTRCQYRFVWKSCDACETQNSPSARYCWKCEHELIDPNAKLTSQASVAPGTPFFVNVESMSLRRHIKGDEPMLRVDYLVNDGNRSFAVSEFFKPENQNPFHRKRLRYFSELVGAHGVSVDDFLAQSDSMSAPDRLLIKREKGSKYYQIESRRRDSISVDN